MNQNTNQNTNKSMKKMAVALALVVLLLGAAFVAAQTAGDAKVEQTETATALEAGQAAAQDADQDANQEVELEVGQDADPAEIPLQTISGAIVELGEDYFVICDALLGDVQVNYSDDTLFEGTQADELALSQVVCVLYDGKMTRSLPPQVFALNVGMYPVSGKVTALGEGSMTIQREEIGDEVIVFLPEDAPQIAVGDVVTAYTNGAMTMSLPAQTTALGVVIGQ